jgi:translocation and assembly module TamB
LLLSALLVATAAWLAATESGLRAALAIGGRLLPGGLDAQGVEGSLLRGFSVQRLRLNVDGTQIEVEQLRLVPRAASLTPLRIDLAEVSAARLRLQLAPASDEKTSPPESLGVPLEMHIERLTVAETLIATAPTAEPTAVRALAAQLTLGPTGYRLDDLRAEFGPTAAPLQLQAQGELAAPAPFAVNARLQLRATVAGADVQADAQATGSLRALALAAQLRGQGGSGQLQAQLDLFGTPLLQRLTADLRELNPAAWWPQAPQARLALTTELAAQPGADFVLAGPIELRNTVPTPLDRDGIPLASARAGLTWSATRIELTGIDAALAGGRLRGSASAALTAPFDAQADVQIDDLRTERLVSRLQALRIDGRWRLQQRDDALQLTGSLRHRGTPAVEAQAELTLTAAQLQVQTLRLLLGPGRAELTGRFGLDATGTLELAGRFEQIDPGVLVRGVDGRLNGKLRVQGQRQPLQGSLDFELTDSMLLGRPLAGRGQAALASNGRLAIDAALEARSARLTARGSLGERDSRLGLTLTAPELRDLGLPAQGRVQLQAQLAGAWPTPALALQLELAKFAYDEQRIEHLALRADYGGGSDGALALVADLTGHVFGARPGFSLRSAQLSVDGRLSEHRIRLDATSALQQPLHLAAAGGWRVPRWSGALTELRSGAPFAVELRAAAPLALSAVGVEFGPAELSVPRARLQELRLSLLDGRLASSGRVVDWRVGREFDTALAAGRPNGAPTLALAGGWDLQLGAQADGRLWLARERGDLYLPSGEPVGLQALQLEAKVEANRAQAQATLRAQRLGTAQAQAQLELERAGNGWRLASQRPLVASASAALDDLAALNLLLADSLRANLRLGGRLDAELQVKGTPAQPHADGTLRGDGLRIAWIEQGLRLQDGRLRAHLDGETLVLDELRFAGAPRIAPPDKRLPVAGDTPGHVALTGRFDLRALRGVAQLQAQRLPLLQRPDRWLIASGQAQVELAREAVRVTGDFKADAGAVDISQPDLPRLSNDVRVSTAAPSQGAATPLRLGLDLGLDLGPAFYLRGRGLDAQIIGQLRLRAESLDSLRAVGTVQARDGSFTAFAHRLVLVRARLNFQGPLDNPGLDVLALRRDLPVEVGVTLTRTLADPLIRLYANPPMAEQETLSWLVLGRSPTSDGLDNPVLARAALGLLSGIGEGPTDRLLRQFGIDELTIRSGEVGSPGSLLPSTTVAGSLRGDTSVNAAREIVVVGKRINDSLTVTYEQALAGAANALLLSYRLTDRLSLVAQAGTDNALNLVYSIAFD